MFELIEQIKQIERLKKELYEKYNISILNYPNDGTTVLVYDYDDFLNIVGDRDFVVFDKPWVGGSEYIARTIIDDIRFDCYLNKKQYREYVGDENGTSND